MKAFIDYVLQFGNLNKQQINLIASKATELELGKDDYYWDAGKPVKQIGFLTTGVLRVYYYNNKGEEITCYFIDENHWILSGNTIDGVQVNSLLKIWAQQQAKFRGEEQHVGSFLCKNFL